MADLLKAKYLSEPLEAKMSEYACFCDECERSQSATECDRVLRQKRHTANVGPIDFFRFFTCPDIVTLLVGPNEVRLIAHRAILAFTSDFFDATLYGGFKKAQSNIMRLPEETPTRVAAFLAWSYSGSIETSVCAFELWVLGVRPGCPAFTNEAMRLIFSTYGPSRWIGAQAADLAQNQTLRDSKIRKFVHDYFESHVPLCKAALKDET
ncbi:uncharacterized protein RAG0_10339 [Rhynchosporium agropyri]|uniref:BTB domain-containing protein n=1 Tax=Rhynchosporium agropyri TaxID=914238 RepID=A0A1E1KZE3_9HELO|nr:uncharacterized protein RAG0_10339 [Rhynchosporium agropyri]